jgi:hypothetical protein
MGVVDDCSGEYTSALDHYEKGLISEEGGGVVIDNIEVRSKLMSNCI